MKSRIRIPLLFALIFLASIIAPIFGQNLHGVNEEIKIPFRYINGFIVTEVQLNDLKLNFILDTGAQHSVLLKKKVVEILNLKLEKEVNLIGADREHLIPAYIIKQLRIKIGKISIDNQSILTLKKNSFNFENLIGVEIHGILGADLFRAYRLGIDYKRKRFTLSPSSKNLPNKKYHSIPINIIQNQSILETIVQNTISVDTVRLLIDTGAAINMLLDVEPHDTLLYRVQLPNELALGLGGSINGYLTRLNKVIISQDTSFQLQKVICSISHNQNISYIKNRDGILGNLILQRFNIYIDYPKKVLYLRPYRYSFEPFEYDKSGLSFSLGGKGHTKCFVSQVAPNSPAHKAGILVGDQIMVVNFQQFETIGIDKLINKLKRKKDKKIKLLVKRGVLIHKFEFKLSKYF